MKLLHCLIKIFLSSYIRRLRHVKIWDDHKSSIWFDDWKSSLLYFEIKKNFRNENERLGLGNSVLFKLT